MQKKQKKNNKDFKLSPKTKESLPAVRMALWIGSDINSSEMNIQADSDRRYRSDYLLLFAVREDLLH